MGAGGPEASTICPVPPKPEQRGPGDGESPRTGVSIRDVASQAGVSVATVSRVMNTPEQVAPPTRARVQAVIDRLGYSPNPHAQQLTSGHSRVIGLALPEFEGEVFGRLLRGADEEAARRGYQLIVTAMTSRHKGGIRPELLGMTDGVICFADNTEDPVLTEVVERGTACVVVGVDATGLGLDSVVLDNERGVREAAEHLLRWVPPSRCHFVGGPERNHDSRERGAAFGASLRKAGHEPALDQMSYGEYSVTWGKEWAMRAHRQGRLTDIGVLAGNDAIACGILRAAEGLRVWCPDQIRIVGCDDTRVAEIVRPSLSTIALPMEQLGAEAVEALVRGIETPGAAPACRRLATRLVVRESSTAAAF